MTLRPLIFPPVPSPAASTEQKVDYLMTCMIEIQRWSHGTGPAEIAREYTVSNLTEDRSYDANSTSTAELADVLGTFLLDLNRGGSKRAL